MPDFTEWLCLVRVTTNLLRKDRRNASLWFLVRLSHEI